MCRNHALNEARHGNEVGRSRKQVKSSQNAPKEGARSSIISVCSSTCEISQQKLFDLCACSSTLVP